MVLLALAMLAGWGLDDLTRREPIPLRRRRLAVGICLAVFLLPVAAMVAIGSLKPGVLGSALDVAWGLGDPPRPAKGGPASAATADVIRMSALLQWLVPAGLGLVLVAWRLGVPRIERLPTPAPAVAVALVVGVLMVDLARATMGFNAAIPVENARQPSTPALELLRSRVPNRFAALNLPERIDQPLQPNLAMRYGLLDARGYDYPVERRYDELWRATAGSPNPVVQDPQEAPPTDRAMRTLSLLSVSELLQYPKRNVRPVKGLRLEYTGPDARVYRNVNALPRAFMVDRQRTVRGSAAALDAVTAAEFDARAAAITEQAIPGVPQAGARPPAASGRARLTRYGREAVTVDTSSRRPGVMVFTDVFFPGWKATVDGREAPIERVDYLLRGVRVPAGRHRVEMSYAPVSWRVGWTLSLMALIGVVLLVVIGVRKTS